MCQPLWYRLGLAARANEIHQDDSNDHAIVDILSDNDPNTHQSDELICSGDKGKCETSIIFEKDREESKNLISDANYYEKNDIENAFEYNKKYREILSYQTIQKRVLKAYKTIEETL